MSCQVLVFVLFLSSTTLCQAKKGPKKTEPGLEFLNFDYCRYNCEDGKSNVGCLREKKPPNVEVEHPPINEFRKFVLDEHNKYRELVASGKEQRPKPGWLKSASDMMVMNYDLELEFLARCQAVQSVKTGKGKKFAQNFCSRRQGYYYVSHLAYGRETNDTLFQTGFIKSWYDEVDALKDPSHIDIMPSFGQLGHVLKFLQVIYWATDLVGCWRLHNPEHSQGWKYTVLCNYGSTLTVVPFGQPKDTVYLQGPPCSKCMPRNQCSTKEYPSLCGTARPIPTTKPPICKGTIGSFNVILLILAIFVLNLVY